jgi:hypothetical protein
MQELHDPSITKALAKSSKAVESSQETALLIVSIPESPEVTEIYSNWRTPFMINLKIGGLPEDKDKHERLRHRVGHYTLVNDELFR